MKQYPRIHRIRLAALTLLVASCANNDFDDLPQLSAGTGVSFRTETQDNYSTRTAGHTTNGAYAIRSIGVYAGYTSAAWNGTTAPNNFFSNLSVSRTSDATPWTYGDEKLWPGSGYLTFFAYAPHSENPVYGGNKPTIVTSTGTPRLTYTIATTHDKQVDLLVATPVKDQTKRDYITIPLRHALSKIAFSAHVANAPAADVHIRVTSIQLSGLYGKGSIPMDGQNRQWDTTGDSNNHSYTVTNATGEGLKTLSLTDTYQPLTPADGHLFLMPQTLVEGDRNTGATITITYETQVGNNVPETKTFDLELSRAITRFNPGMAYNLMFTIDNGVTFIVAPTPWDNTEVQADIKNRILNVSRIEAPVYPGVPTRIWFWSNQPKDSVYVRTNGNIDNSRYPTGTPYIVNNVFQNLSLARAANLTHRGIDEATITKDPTLEKGEGYIDVWHATNATTPFAPILTDGDQRHIWLNASGLTRNILLNSVIRSNPTTTPYVGTFHRWNETGERIVTWGAPYNWTATILDPISTGADILIDNQPSPYMTTGQLYGDPTKDVGDPEAAQLSPTAKAPVSGTGRVYFRVGWKSRLASANTSPRYGRIEVKEYQADGITVAATRILYIRQGEREDYVMRPGDPNGGSADARLLAVKWSPYNLTAASIGTGGVNLTDHPQLTLNGGVFTQYPTQAGAYFTWAPGNVANQRRAFHPQNPLAAAISGWNTWPTVTTSTWNTLMTTHETCPPGYRRPFHGSITAPMGSISNSEFKHSLFTTYSNQDDQATLNPNRLFGYYADGFFDRRRIVSDVQVSVGNATVAYIGGLFYNPTTYASLFFPTVGRRTSTGSWHPYYSSESIGLTTIAGFYTSSARSGSNGQILYMNIHNNAAGAGKSWQPNEGISIRCVRDIGFVTDLKPETEVLVPTALSFDVADPAIGPTTVQQYTNNMVAAIAAIASPPHLLRARITFTGTVTSTTGSADVTNLLTSTFLKMGSKATYDFSAATFAIGASISVAVSSNNWEFSINNGATWTEGDTGKAAVLTAKGTIVLRKKN